MGIKGNRLNSMALFRSNFRPCCSFASVSSEKARWQLLFASALELFPVILVAAAKRRSMPQRMHVKRLLEMADTCWIPPLLFPVSEIEEDEDAEEADEEGRTPPLRLTRKRGFAVDDGCPAPASKRLGLTEKLST